MNVYYLMPQGGRWFVIILSMTQAEQTSNLSPYCNELMFRNSNYLFDRLTNDKNSSISVDTHAGVCSNANICTCSHSSWWSQRSCLPLTPPVTSPLIFFLDQNLMTVGAGSQSVSTPFSVLFPPATAIIWIPNCVMTLMNYIFIWNDHASLVYLLKSAFILHNSL